MSMEYIVGLIAIAAVIGLVVWLVQRGDKQAVDLLRAQGVANEQAFKAAADAMQRAAKAGLQAVYGPGSLGTGEDEAPVSQAQEGGGANGNTPLPNGQAGARLQVPQEVRDWYNRSVAPEFWPVQPESDEDPVQLNQPLDHVDAGAWTPVEQLGHLADRPRAMGIAPGEDPFEGLDFGGEEQE